MRAIALIKQVIFNRPYLMLYPILEKTDKYKKALVDAFNTCDLNEDTEISMLLSALYSYALDKCKIARLNDESIERNMSYSYKMKRIKEMNDEDNKRKINKVAVEKKGVKAVNKVFQHLKEKNNTITEKYDKLVKAFESSSLTVDDLPLCDELLKDNRFKKWTYRALIVTVLSLPIIVFILAKVLNI